MSNILKYLLFSFVFCSISFGDILTWGGYSKIEITQNKVDAIIKNYVDTTYPQKVQDYNNQLNQIKKSKINSVSNNTFIEKNLMWQDTMENTTIKLNQLESKIYCRKLILAKRKDWRLPTYKELLSLVDYQKSNPASIEKIEHIVSGKYWSDTQKNLPKKQKEKSFWYVDFTQGSSNYASEMGKKQVRCVRELSLKKDDY